MLTCAFTIYFHFRIIYFYLFTPIHPPLGSEASCLTNKWYQSFGLHDCRFNSLRAKDQVSDGSSWGPCHQPPSFVWRNWLQLLENVHKILYSKRRLPVLGAHWEWWLYHYIWSWSMDQCRQSWILQECSHYYHSTLCLSRIEFNRISMCSTAKEIWDKLEVTYEETSRVKESKINLLVTQYEVFKMDESESIN